MAHLIRRELSVRVFGDVKSPNRAPAERCLETSVLVPGVPDLRLHSFIHTIWGQLRTDGAIQADLWTNPHTLASGFRLCRLEMRGRVASLSAKQTNKQTPTKATNLICPAFVCGGPHGCYFLLSRKKRHVRACAFEDDEGGQVRGELLFIATVSLSARGLSGWLILPVPSSRAYAPRPANELRRMTRLDAWDYQNPAVHPDERKQQLTMSYLYLMVHLMAWEPQLLPLVQYFPEGTFDGSPLVDWRHFSPHWWNNHLSICSILQHSRVKSLIIGNWATCFKNISQLFESAINWGIYRFLL